MKKKNIDIEKNKFAISNDLIRTPNKLPLNSLQILGVVLSHYDWKENDNEKISIEVPTKEIINVLSSKSNNYEFYEKEIYKFLITSNLVIDKTKRKNNELTNEFDKRNDMNFEFYQMFPYANVDKEKCSFEINHRLNEYFQLLKKNFTIYQIANTVNFTSRFSYVLYLNLFSWNDHNEKRNDPLDERKRYYTTAQLKKMFDLSETDYTIRQKNGTNKFNRHVFEKKVIEKAVIEINAYTNIKVQYYKEYEGKKVSRYVFEWFRKDGYDYETGTTKI